MSSKQISHQHPAADIIWSTTMGIGGTGSISDDLLSSLSAQPPFFLGWCLMWTHPVLCVNSDEGCDPIDVPLQHTGFGGALDSLSWGFLVATRRPSWQSYADTARWRRRQCVYRSCCPGTWRQRCSPDFIGGCRRCGRGWLSLAQCDDALGTWRPLWRHCPVGSRAREASVRQRRELVAIISAYLTLPTVARAMIDSASSWDAGSPWEAVISRNEAMKRAREKLFYSHTFCRPRPRQR